MDLELWQSSEHTESEIEEIWREFEFRPKQKKSTIYYIKGNHMANNIFF